MKTFKTIDLFISISLIIAFTLYWLIKQDSSFMIAYFVVGGWQASSMLVHAYNKCLTYKGGSRNIYHRVTLISLVTLPLGSFWILLFAAPFMAIYYTYLCFHDLYIKMQRPLAMLK